jgi:hypothetical protein
MDKEVIDNNTETTCQSDPIIKFLLGLTFGRNLVWVDAKRRHEFIQAVFLDGHEEEEQGDGIQNNEFHTEGTPEICFFGFGVFFDLILIHGLECLAPKQDNDQDKEQENTGNDNLDIKTPIHF